MHFLKLVHYLQDCDNFNKTWLIDSKYVWLKYIPSWPLDNNDDFPTCGPYRICYLEDEEGFTY